ncbi:MAG: hypothetical protein HOI69_02275, partial [Gammaproteobacteria bacterium]|nr:hypothetical protein [Gammaproteobacteria bacterium]
MIELLKHHSFSATFLVLFLSFVFFFGSDGEEIQRLNGFTMGTSYQVQIVDMPNDISAENLAADISDLLSELDTGIFSTYARNSELSRFNRHGVNVPFIASSRMIEVLLLAQEVAAL